MEPCSVWDSWELVAWGLVKPPPKKKYLEFEDEDEDTLLAAGYVP